MPTLLQLSDLHLFADKGALLKGVNPWQSFQRVLDAARGSGIEFDHVVFTGDLAHDGQRQTYEHVREALGEWVDRAWFIPGNHDDRSHCRSRLPGATSGPTPLLAQVLPGRRDLPDRVTFSFAAGNWRVIGLDTLVPGELSGLIGADQLAWLQAELARYAAAPTLLFLHHPPVEVGSAWLDRIGLANRELFCRLFELSPQVRLVCCGHIHQELEGRVGAATVLAAPSTSVQFKPRTETLVCDDLPSGFRVLRLREDGFETQVVRAAD